MSRAVFLDVDGTYADRGVVPPGHEHAVRAARAAGHRVFLCTGRSKSMLSEHLLAAGFDGLVAGAGGYVEVGGEVLLDRRFPEPVARRLLEVLDVHDAVYVLEAPEAPYGRPVHEQRLLASLEGVGAIGGHGRDTADDVLGLQLRADLNDVRFTKVSVVDGPLPVAQLAAMVGPELGALPSSLPGMTATSAGEIYLADVHKALGMAMVTRHLGLERADVVAFGDGLNDLEMLEFAGVAVAVEGADPRLVERADFITRGPAQEGLAHAFVQLGLC